MPRAGGELNRVELTDVSDEAESWSLDLIALHEALNQLAVCDPRATEVVKLRFFAGLTRQQAAEILGISFATADNDWAYAKGWLKAKIQGN